MRQFLSIGRLIPRIVLAAMAFLLLAGAWAACAPATGACVGTTGGAGGPYCKNGWTSGECSDWNSQGINGATWVFYAGNSCGGLGYTPTP